VREILKFTMHGRTFAYRVIMDLTVLEGGRPRYAGGTLIALYVDPDGSGLFKVMREAALMEKLIVPDWIKMAPKSDAAGGKDSGAPDRAHSKPTTIP
jgi:hypothetical protein